MSCVAEDPSVVKWLLDIGADIDRYRRTLDIDKFRGEHPIHKAVNPLMSNGFLSDIWTELTIALCGYPIVKMEIRDSSQISTTAPIFLLYNYFRQKYLKIASCAVSLLNNIWVRVEHSLLQQLNLQKVNCSSSSLQSGCE